MTAPRRLQLRRGNSTAISSYTGAAGELVVNTTDWTLYVHDGSTVGGYATTTNTTSITNQISSVNANITVANLGMKGYVDQANTIQSAQISAANIGMKGYVDSVANQSIYGNSNVKSYLTSGFDGNILPSANVTYSLGSATRQWKDLWVSNNTIYIGGVPLSIDAGGNLTVGGNVVTGSGGTNLVTYSGNVSAGAITLSGPTGAVGNVKVLTPGSGFTMFMFYATSGGSGTGLSLVAQGSTIFDPVQFNARGTGYRVGDIITVVNDITGPGYSDATVVVTELLGVVSPGIFVGNTAYKFGADGNIRLPAGGDILDSSGVSILDGYATTTDITTANTGVKGYVDQANTIQSNQLISANLGIIGYINQGNTIQSAQIASANVGMKGYIDATIAANIGNLWVSNSGTDLWLRSIYNNNIYISPDDINALFVPKVSENLTTSLTGYSTNGLGLFTANAYISMDDASNFSSGNIALLTSFNNNNYKWTFGTDGRFTAPGDVYGQYFTVRGGGSPGDEIGSLGYGGNIVELYGTNGVRISTVGEGGPIWQFGINGNITFPDLTVQSTAFSNAAIDTYLIAETNKNIHGNVTIYGNLFVNGNLSYISVNNFTTNDNIINLADLNPADTLDLGITAHRTVNGLLQHTGLIRDASANQWKLFSNVTQNVGTTVDFTDAVYDALQVGAITSPTIDTINNNIAAANAAWAFANTIQSAQVNAANLAITAANVGMKGYVDSQTFYSNARVATYLQYGNISNISVAGNVTAGYFIGNGALLTGIAASSSYSNVQVATYLPTYTGNLSAGNANVISNLTVGGYLTTSGSGGNISGANYITANIILTNGGWGNISQVANIQANAVLVSGNVTATYFLGNGALLTGITASGSSYSNVQVATYLPTYTGVVTASNIAVNGNVTAQYLFGNGSQLTGLSSSYSNVQVATYLPTYAGNIANIRLGVSGVLTFADSSTQTSAYSNIQTTAYTITQGYTNYSNINVKAYTETMGFQNYGNANVTAYLPSHTGNVGVNYLLGTTPNVTLTAGSYNSVFDTTGNVILPTAYVAGNVTAGYFIGNGALLTGIAASSNYSNVQVEVFTNLSNYAYNANVTSANLGMKGYVDNSVSTANIGMKGYVDSVASQSIYGNINVKAYTESMGFTNYSNVNVASYLSTATINTTGNITAAYISGNISVTGNVTGTSPNVTIQAGSYTSVFDNLGNVTVPRLFTAGNVQTAGYLFGNGAFLTGVVTGSSYSNVQVATYLPTYTGVVTASNVAVAGNVTAQYLFGNGSQLTGIASSYSNVQVAAYLNTNNYSPYSNVNVAVYLTTATITTSGNITAGNITATSNLTVTNYITTSGTGGNISGVNFYLGNLAILTGNITASSFIGSGALLTSLPGYAYGNVNVASYLGATQITVANIRLSASGNIVFPDGTVQTTAASGSYSNVQVATYLPTYTGVITASNVAVNGNVTAQYLFGNGSQLTGIAGNYSNVQVATYLPLYGGAVQSSNVQTTSANIQTTTAATNTATGALRVMGGVGVAGAVVAAQLNSTGNLIANAISAYSLNTVANVVASVVNAGTINSAGNVLAQNLTGTLTTASQTAITAVGTLATLSVSGNATVGNLVGNEANTRIIANTYTTTFDIYGNVTFPGNVITPTGLYVGPTGYTVLPTTIAQFTGNANTYTQLNIQNISTGTDATSEYVATANNGTDTTFFVDMGIANSNYDVNSPNNSLGTAIYPNDSYLYAQGNLSTTTGGNLVIGTSTAGKTVKIFAGGINSSNVVVTVTNTGANIGGYGVTAPTRPAFRVNGSAGPAQTTSNVNLKGAAVTTIFNQGGYFDATTGKFTAPVAGIYEVSLVARVNTNSTSQIAVLKNGVNSSSSIVCFWEADTSTGTATHFGTSGTVIMAAGDYLSANILLGTISFDGNDNWCVTYLG